MPVNQQVNVNSFYFQNGRGLRSFPKQIELENARYTFNDGLQFVVGKGPRAIKFFDMTDGQTHYRLRLQSGIWTLLSTRVSE